MDPAFSGGNKALNKTYIRTLMAVLGKSLNYSYSIMEIVYQVH
jgi:hypothetical protein